MQHCDLVVTIVVKHTNEPMRVNCIDASAAPEDVQMFIHELDGETEGHIMQIHEHFRILETLDGRSFGDCQFAIGKGQLLDVSSTELHLVTDVDLIFLGDKPQRRGIRLLVTAVHSSDTNGTHPGDFRPAGVWQKHGVHLDLLIADEVEGKVVLSLYCET